MTRGRRATRRRPPAGSGRPVEEAGLDPREGAGSKAWTETQTIVREHGSSRSARRRAARTSASAGRSGTPLHDHGRHLHEGLRLLQRAHRPADALDAAEPEKIADSVAKLGLHHVVITSVDRDDLADGGATHFARTIAAIRRASPGTTVEILTPDFLRKEGALEIVVAAKPDVFNHNLETVPAKYLTVRPGARYFHSVRLLQRVKELDPTIFTKSGIMVGLGEERNEVLQLMDDLRSAEVDFLTIGQYLQPSKKHHAVMRFVPPDEFKGYETTAYAKGFLLVSATPLTRSSHHAGEDFARLQAARLAKLSPALSA